MAGTVCPRCCDECAPGSAFCASCGTNIRRTCSSCAAEWPAEYAFCAACGTRLGLACPQCESEWPAEYAFCGKCGTQLQTGATAPAATRVAPAAAAAPPKPKAKPKPPPRPAAPAKAQAAAPAAQPEAEPASAAPPTAAKQPGPKPAPAKPKAEPKPKAKKPATPVAKEPRPKAEPAKPAVEIQEAPKTAEAKAAAKLVTDDPALAPAHEAVREGRIDEARETFEQVIASARKKEDAESKALLAAALSGMARVYLRSSEFDKLLECGQTLTATAVGPAQQAIGEHWTAVAHWRKGELEHATTHFEAAVAAATAAGASGREVLAETLCDQAHMQLDGGRMAEAKKTIRAARRALRAKRGPSIPGIDADLVEGGIARREGRQVDALQLYSSAHAAAKEIGSARQCADAGISLAEVRYLMGDYERARRPFEEALAIGKKLGDARISGNASMGLCALAVAQGDRERAREHILEGLATWEAAGDRRGMALAHTNLALLSTHEQDWPTVIEESQKILELLAGGVDEQRRGRVLSMLGDAQLANGDVEGARASYETVTAEFTQESAPRLVALAWRGLGRVEQTESDADAACSWFRQAVEALALAKEESESAEVRLELAEALIAAADRQGARHQLSRARDQFERVQASEALTRRLEELESLAGS